MPKAKSPKAQSGRRQGLVLQGGGALGSFELGAARVIYSDRSAFRPDVIAGVSIGAVSAVLLARPAAGYSPLEALEAFWREVTTLDSPLFPLSALFANPPFYVPKLTLTPFSTSLYDTAPLLKTLARLVDVDALADPAAEPRLILTATKIKTSELKVFDSASADTRLTLKHVLASGSLPPGFPATKVDDDFYWDGGVFDNTPLGAVLDALDGQDPAVLVVNLFPKRVPLPQTMAEVLQTFSNLLFVNKTESDLKLMRRFNTVAQFMAALDEDFGDDPRITSLPGYQDLKTYRRVAKVMSVTRRSESRPLEGSDFSKAGLERRAIEGHAETEKVLAENHLLTS